MLGLRRFQVFTPLMVLMLLGAIGGFTLQQRDDERRTGPSLFSRDSHPAGTLALAMWLERLGYNVDRLEWTVAVPGRDTDLLFLLKPTRRLSANEAEDLVHWIADGGTLVYHPNVFFPSTSTTSLSDGLSDALGLEARRVPRVASVSMGLPLVTRPGLSEVGAAATVELILQDAAWAPLLINQRGVFGASRRLGQGRVYALTTPALFDNENLAENGNRDVLLSLLARHPEVHRVAFDEYHHGLVRDPDLMSAVRGNAWGWALMYAVVATLLFLIWGGKRFGPAIVPERVMGRSTGDYVSALAGLLQRSRSASWAQRESARLFRGQLSRLLGTRVNASVPELIGALQGRQGGVATDLADAIRELEGSPLSERALLERVRRIEGSLRVVRGGEGAR
ncbi:MAG TPA: DUF4350 domain-containing protein [Chloroflexota bacterium]|nr:DUF4350 domain-containing protein [Chloroflexota bacterium]